MPSALIALTGTSPLTQGRGLPAATLAVADEVAPAAKIMFAILFALMLLLARRVALSSLLCVMLDMFIACLSTVLVLAFLPADWSRGFGIGLTGARFAFEPLLIYLGGAMLAGFSFSMSERNCLTRARPKGEGDPEPG